MIKLRLIFSLVAFAFLAACLFAAAPAPASAAQATTAAATKTTASPALQKLVAGKQKLSISATQQKQVLASKKVKVGSGGLSFSCNAVVCACRGDADCNDMFTTDVCGPRAICIDNVCFCGRP